MTKTYLFKLAHENSSEIISDSSQGETLQKAIKNLLLKRRSDWSENDLKFIRYQIDATRFKKISWVENGKYWKILAFEIKAKSDLITLSEEAEEALKRVLEYLEHAESKDYFELFEDPENPTDEELEQAKDHIYTSVKKLQSVLTEKLVFRALNNAQVNGGDCFADSAHRAAVDLVSFDSSLEDYIPDALVPYVEKWRKENGKD